ncbi:MAG: plastocyanin/azurin family copper-binding protein [Nanoarchaeota archaeon]|nr:plastocyanin/azurin family copper-binding protein [Nanoarchaeota archaeon]
MKKESLYGILLVAMVFLVGCTTATQDRVTETVKEPTVMEVDERQEAEVVEETKTEEMMDEVEEETMESEYFVKTYVLTGENFKFLMDGKEAPELRVQEGDRVRIEFTSTDGFHDFVVDEFNAATERVNTDGSTFVEFVADKKGTFEYYCSVGSHRANGMKGNLVVE